MDITAIRRTSDVSGLTEDHEQYSGNDTATCNITNIFGRKSDALSAVKLDPAVLEAQVTLTNLEAANPQVQMDNSSNARSLVPKKVSESEPKPRLNFIDMVRKQEAALLSLTPQQMELLMNFTDTMRQQRRATQKHLECSFCKKNGKAAQWYTSHCLKDSRGCVKCPVLRAFKCHLCGGTGDHAHTIKYCPEKILLDAGKIIDINRTSVAVIKGSVLS